MMAVSPVKIMLFGILLCAWETSSPVGQPTVFESKPVSFPVKPGKLDEASGIADSRSHPGYLWVEEDSGNPNQICLLSHTGQYFKKIRINGATNRDWEDMVLGAGPEKDKYYIYLGDIGSNKASASRYFIYRFPEPALNTEEVNGFDKLEYRYPDGGHDAEAMLVDNNTKDIYIITKRDKFSAIYKLAYPQATAGVNRAILVGKLGFNGVVSAASSADGKELLVKTYTDIYYWKRNPGQSIEKALTEKPVSLSYQLEPQGEAVCFKNDNSGFFTLSEKPSFMTKVNLNFYKRKAGK